MIVPVTDVDIRFVAEPWPAPAALRAQVPAIWARLVAANPHLWDGRILGISGVGGGPPRVEAGVLRGEAREDSFSAFMAWRELGWPEIGLRNVFGSAVLISADGAVLLGRMGATTANAGQIYPPAGSLEPADVADGRVDVFGSLARELGEETGLDAGEARAGATVAIFDGPRISVARALHFPVAAGRARACRYRGGPHAGRSGGRRTVPPLCGRAARRLRRRPLHAIGKTKGPGDAGPFRRSSLVRNGDHSWVRCPRVCAVRDPNII
jgi:8-oxo-dGTP pyrophosphatase MutT (NUDIX family)